MENIKSKEHPSYLEDQVDKMSRLLLERRKYLWENISRKTSKKDDKIKSELNNLLEINCEPEADQLVYYFINRWCAPFKTPEIRTKIDKSHTKNHEPGLDRVIEAVTSLQENMMFFTDYKSTRKDLPPITFNLLSPLEKIIFRAEVERILIDYDHSDLLKKRHPLLSINQEEFDGGIKLHLSK